MLSSIFGNVSQSLAQNPRLALVPREGGKPLEIYNSERQVK